MITRKVGPIDLFRPHLLRFFGIFMGVWVGIAFLLAMFAGFLSNPVELDEVINCLSDIRMTPAWPMIGLFSTPVP